MKFGIGIAPSTAQETAALARAAEARGFSWFGVADSPLYGDCFSHLCVAAGATSTIAVGPAVTSPTGRPPVLLRAGLRTLCDVAPGRVLGALATGNSMARGLGVKPARLEELAGCIAEMHTSPVATRRRRPRLLFAADGPRGATMAAHNEDGWLLGAGLDREGRAELLRSRRFEPTAPGWEWWIATTASTEPDLESAMDAVGGLVVAMGNRALRADAEHARFPAGLLADVRRLNESYDYGSHGQPGANVRLLSPDLRSFMLDRLCLWGGEDRWDRILSEVAEDGASGLLIYLAQEDRASELEQVAARLEHLGHLGNREHTTT